MKLQYKLTSYLQKLKYNAEVHKDKHQFQYEKCQYSTILIICANDRKKTHK
jgi:hypothetical protein